MELFRLFSSTVRGAPSGSPAAQAASAAATVAKPCWRAPLKPLVIRCTSGQVRKTPVDRPTHTTYACFFAMRKIYLGIMAFAWFCGFVQAGTQMTQMKK